MRDRKVTGMERICGTCFYDERTEDLEPCKSCKEYGNWLPRIKEKPEQNPVQNADPQDAKADEGKLDLTLVPTKAIRDCAIVRDFGNRKYGSRDNWKQVSVERYTAALYRHLLAFIDDPNGVDEESGIQHYKHLLCNACFISALMEE